VVESHTTSSYSKLTVDPQLGGAALAAELDAKRAIRHGTELAAKL
jgi:hypothetical protein